MIISFPMIFRYLINRRRFLLIRQISQRFKLGFQPLLLLGLARTSNYFFWNDFQNVLPYLDYFILRKVELNDTFDD